MPKRERKHAYTSTGIRYNILGKSLLTYDLSVFLEVTVMNEDDWNMEEVESTEKATPIKCCNPNN